MKGTTVHVGTNNNEKNFILLSVLDHVLAAVVIAPTVVGYWRATWCLHELYLFPGNADFSMLTSLVIGLSGQLIFTYGQKYLTDNLHPSKNRFIYFVTSRIYTYIFGIVCINMWKGIWMALDMFSGQEPVKVLIPTVTSLIFLAVSRILRNLTSSPFVVAVDLPDGYFTVPTMFKLMGSKVDSLFVLDSLFSVFVVGSLVIFSWRGVWCLIDIFVYPDDEVCSALISLVVGYSVVFFVFSVESIMKKLCDNLSGFGRLAALDVYTFLSFIGTINVWRGFWNLINIYVLPESPALRSWIIHVVCFVFLVIINCSNTVLVRGVALDGEEEGGKCVVFPVSYLRTIFPVSEKEAEGHPEKKNEKMNEKKNDATV